MAIALSTADQAVLGSYQFIEDPIEGELSGSGINRSQNDELLCLRKINKQWQLDTVNSSDITCWNLFKRFWGLGPLAQCKLSLRSIAKHLCRHDLQALSSDSRAYATIHGIAARQLAHDKEKGTVPKLWRRLSVQSKTYDVKDETIYKRYKCYCPNYTWGHYAKPDYNGLPNPYWDKEWETKQVTLYHTAFSQDNHLHAQIKLLLGKEATGNPQDGFTASETVEEYDVCYCQRCNCDIVGGYRDDLIGYRF